MGDHHALLAESEEHTTVATQGFGSEFRHLAQQRRFERSTASTPPPLAAPVAGPNAAAPATATARTRSPLTTERISTDARSMLIELSRMADRVIEARELLVVERERTVQLTSQLEASNQRLMAARAIVHDAQQTAHAAATRCEFLEGRCDALQEALDLALHAGMITRWKWRRRMRTSTASRNLGA